MNLKSITKRLLAGTCLAWFSLPVCLPQVPHTPGDILLPGDSIAIPSDSAAVLPTPSTASAVGKIDDTFSVSPSGQFSYEIPIPVLPGTGGISPKLSVCYNSSAKDGLLGYGFDLTGLSIISRVPADRTHDGQAGTVSFNGSAYSLDGMRILRTAYGSNWRQYAAETNGFSKITAYGSVSCPDSFVVHTKSGLKYEYLGNRRILNPNDTEPSLFWMLTKVTDTSGNYFLVSYVGDNTTDEIYPSRIDYTGNDGAGLVPYCSVRFSYISNPCSPTVYIDGRAIHRKKVLSAIALYSGQTMERRFSMSYDIYGHKYLLASVTETAADGSIKPATSFDWNRLDDFSLTNVNYQQTDLIHKAALTTGDFNGDGRADFVALPENGNAGWKGIKVFVSNGHSFSQTFAASSTSSDDACEAAVGDYNTDGYDDIVVLHKTQNGFYNSWLYLTEINGGSLSLRGQGCIFSSDRPYSIHAVETDGDGRAELFAWHPEGRTCHIFHTNQQGDSILSVRQDKTCDEKLERVEFIDIDGDGLTDMLNLTENGYVLHKRCGDGANSYLFGTEGSFPTRKHHIVIGDYNGDGKSDLMLTGHEDHHWGYWVLVSSDGHTLFRNTNVQQVMDDRNYQPYAMDVDGDGRDDFYGIIRTGQDGVMYRPKIYLNTGTGALFTEASDDNNFGGNSYGLDKWNFYPGDYNGDGKPDMLATATWETGSTWDGYQLYLMPETPHDLLKSVTDGYGNTTEVTYKYLSDATVHTRGTTNEYPLTSMGSSWPVVYKVHTPNGIGGRNAQTYHYTNALVHRDGRGVLGFEEVTVADSLINTTTTTQYLVDTVKYMVGIRHTETKRGNVILSTSDIQYNELSPNQAVFSFHPVSTTETAYDYNHPGTILSQTTTTSEYDDYGNVTRTCSSNGNITTTTENTYVNDTGRWLLGRLTESVVTKSGASGLQVRRARFEYDTTTGLLTDEYTEPYNTVLGYRKSYTHDEFGNITKSIVTPNDPLLASRSDSTAYDSKGRHLICQANALGHISRYYIDSHSALLQRSVDANGLSTTYEYDSFGRNTRTVTPTDTTTSVLAWSVGHADAPSHALYYSRETSTGSPSVTTFYDSLGRTIRTVTEAPGGKKVYVDVVYNAKGEVWKTSEPYFSDSSDIYWSISEYDPVGRIIRQTAPDGTYSTFAYSGFTTTATDPLGHTSTKTADTNGNLILSIDNEGGTVAYEYDVAGHCTRITGPRTTIQMEYDLMGNRTLLNDPDLGTVTSVYNAYGELVSQTDSKGTTTYDYDQLGRLLTETRPDVTVTNVYDTQFIGSLTSTTASNGTATAYAYDSYGRITSQAETVGSKTFTTQTTYNSLNKVDAITYPNGRQVRNVYDTGTGILTSVTDNSGQQAYWQLGQLNARGQVCQETFGNGLTTTTAYHAQRGYVTAISTPGIQNWTYAFNAVGNLTSRADVTRNLTETFTYDGLDRLVTVSRNGTLTQEMTYDAAGNLLSKTDVGHGFQYAEGTNRLTSFYADSPLPKLWNNILYTSFHKIQQVSQDGATLTLTYGPGKRRVKAQTVKGGVTEAKYYAGSLYEETFRNGTSVRQVCYVIANGHAVAIIESTPSSGGGWGETAVYLHHDHLGSIMAYSDASGQLLQELSYDAWGRRRDPSTWDAYDRIAEAAAWHERGFGGHEHLDLFEMVNMDGRMYDPVLGRFLSPDPFVQAPDYTQSLNRYAYCLNNPLSLIDPSGYSWLGDNWKSLVASAVGIAVGAITAGSGAALGVAIIAGAAGGAASAMTGALLNGANFKEVAKATFTGAFWGAVSGFLNYASADDILLAKLFKHAFSEGFMEGVQGGNFVHGFMMGAVSSGGGTLIDHYGDAMGKAGQIAANAVLSGTVDELGGGKFANGAITGAFSIMFNDMMHGGPEKSVMDKVHEALDLIGMVPGLDIADGINAVIYVCQGDAGNAALCAVAIIPVVGNVATAGKVAKKAMTYSVYVGEKGGVVKYVGITKRDPNIRFTEHKRSKTARSSLDFSVLKNTGNLTQLQARIIEQQNINKYGLNNLLNQRNSIAPQNWHLYNINK